MAKQPEALSLISGAEAILKRRTTARSLHEYEVRKHVRISESIPSLLRAARADACEQMQAAGALEREALRNAFWRGFHNPTTRRAPKPWLVY